jgi:hypothetical protein
LRMENGFSIQFNNLTDWDVKPEFKTARCDPMNSPPGEKMLPSGHRGTFSVDRQDGTNDANFTAIENGYWLLGSSFPGLGNGGTFTKTTTEVSGAQTVEQYIGVCCWLSDSGSYKQDSPVKQKISMYAAQKVS